MLAIAAMALMLGNGQQQYSCADYTSRVKAALMSRYSKPFLPPPEQTAYAGKVCKIHVETNQYGNVLKIEPTDCSPSEIITSNRLLAGLQLPVHQAPGCNVTVMDMVMPK